MKKRLKEKKKEEGKW